MFQLLAAILSGLLAHFMVVSMQIWCLFSWATEHPVSSLCLVFKFNRQVQGGPGLQFDTSREQVQGLFWHNTSSQDQTFKMENTHKVRLHDISTLSCVSFQLSFVHSAYTLAHEHSLLNLCRTTSCQTLALLSSCPQEQGWCMRYMGQIAEVFLFWHSVSVDCLLWAGKWHW